VRPCKDHGLKGNKQGYARKWHEGKKKLYHRVVFFLANGFWPEVVMHSCDNSRCIEETHLLAGTWDSNNKDRAAKGRSAKTRTDLRKLTTEDAKVIRSRYSPKRCRVNGVSALAREYGVDTKAIYQIVKGITYAQA
jgi:hypothetical protein